MKIIEVYLVTMMMIVKVERDMRGDEGIRRKVDTGRYT